MKSPMKKPFLVAASVSVMLFATATFANPSSDTSDFIKKAAIGNKFEIEASRLALARSKNTDVRDFATQMIKEHGVSEQNLEKAVRASNTGATAENVPVRVDQKHQDILNNLEKLSGKDFDEKFADVQQDAHENAIELFKDYAKDGDDKALKNYAGETLPTLKGHKDHVEKLKDSL